MDISGIGVDVVDISRVRHWPSDRLMMEFLFTPVEQEMIKRYNRSEILTAVFFAIKEAVFKASGDLLRKAGFKDIEINKKGTSGYKVTISSDFIKDSEFEVSLSFTSDMAIAKAIMITSHRHEKS